MPISYTLFNLLTVPRENEAANFGRHINLQLTYSFQQNSNSHNPLHIGNNNNNNNNNNSSKFTTHGNCFSFLFILTLKIVKTSVDI